MNNPVDSARTREFNSANASAESGVFQRSLMTWLVEKAGLDLPTTRWRHYGIVVVAVVFALVLRALLDPLMGERGSYGFFLIATAFVSWRCGMLPGLATVVVGAVLGTYFFEMPRGSFLFRQTSVTSLATSLLIGTATAVFCGSLRFIAMENARLYRLAKQADARKDEFLAMLGHELRNPLAPIRNGLYLLDACGPHDPEAEKLHRLISQHVDHVVRLVDDLLDVARITQNKIALHRERIDLGSVIDAALAESRPLINEKKHDVQITLPPHKIFLYADRLRMTQVVVNLLNNAAKYTDRGGRIWLTAEVQNAALVLRVRDTGVGLTPEEMARIFDLFEQASHSVKNAQGGLGIGLTLVRKLIDLHDGTVEVASAGPGLGCEFVVRMPLPLSYLEPPPADNVRSATDAAGTIVTEGKSSAKVMVVEDVAATASTMASLLTLWGYNTSVCRDAFTALETLRTFKPDVALIDIGLPRMNGYQLAEEIRRRPGLSGAVLIAVTGYGQMVDVERSRQAGFDRHLTKPVDPLNLERVLTELAPAGTT